ncbi:MAG: ABC transporter ATP-binding protein [Tepidisphaeraceae bacterium]
MSSDFPSTALSTPELPPDLIARLNGELRGEAVLAWAEFDLDESNRLARSFAVLTAEDLFVIDGTVVAYAIEQISEAKIVEGLGMDRLIVRTPDRLGEMRYSRRCRRDIVNLHRKLARLLPNEQGKRDDRPAWLDRVESQAEQQERCPKCGDFIPAHADRICPRCAQSRAILWRLMDIAKPYRGAIFFSLGLTLFHSLIASSEPLVRKYLIDKGIVPVLKMSNAERLHSLWFWGAVTVGVIFLSEAIGGWRMGLLSNIGTRVTADLRHKVYEHMHSLSLRFFNKRRTGSLITRVTADTDRIWDFIAFGSINLVRDFAMILVMMTIMFWQNWLLAVIALAPLPFIAVATYLRGKKMHKLFGRMWNYWSRVSAVVGDALGGVKVVKAFAGEGREIVRFDRRNDAFTEKELEVNTIWWQLQPTVSGAMRLGGLSVFIFGGYLIIKHPEDPRNTIGTLLMFAQYVNQFYGPINEIASSSRMVTRAASSAQRVFEVLDTQPEVYGKSNAVKKTQMLGRVEFRNVGFSYEGQQPALRDVSLTIEPGQMIGLCGHSGAGKSTFVNLLCRFYDVTEGQILIDGVDVRDYDLQWLRQQVGVVLQEPYLFHGTIADNIRYGRPDASDAEVIAAAKAANAHDFIVGVPDGYDTMVGERGQSLSGGERQRVSIARAILHNPKILVLDEATSSLDTETERQIQEAMDRLVTGRTTIAIAHRLSTLTAADKLVVLDKGRIAEEGTHEELFSRPDGIYAKLYQTQMEMNARIAVR